MALSKARERLVENLVSSLEDRVIPWDKPWNVDYANSFIPPVNAVTKSKYNGLNQVILFISSLENEYNDNRWLTFKQIKDKEYKLQEGSKGVPVEFFQFKDKKTGKEFDFDTYNKLSTDEQKEKIKDLYRINKTYYVFNASRVDGIEPLLVVEVDKNKQINEINDKVKNVISNMDLNSFNESGVSAYYSYLNDTVNVPPKSLFQDEIYFNGTIIHELAHATLHEKRLDRPEGKSGRFGSDAYALEELRAEISSLFVSNELGMKLEVQHERNNTAYIQNWLSVLKNEPEKIFDAIKDANKISDFLIDKSKDRNLEYVFKSSLNNNEMKNMDLTRLNIPLDVEKIGSINHGNTTHEIIDLRGTNVKHIIKNGFKGFGIKEITFDDGVEILDKECLKDNLLNKVTIPQTVKYIEKEALANNPIKVLEFSGNNPPLMEEDFLMNTNIEKIVIPDGKLKEYKEIFEDSDIFLNSLKKSIDEILISKTDYEKGMTINEKVVDTYIVKNMEYSMKNLNEFKIDNRVTEIGNNSYSINDFPVVDLIGCHNLKKIGHGSFQDSYIEELYLNDELEWINEGCFKNNNLKNVVFGSCLVYIGAEAFGDNKSLKMIEFTGKTPPVLAYDAFLHDRLEKIIVPQNCVKEYKENLNTSNFLMMCKEKDIDKLVVGKEDYEISQSVSKEHIIDELDMSESMSLAM